MTKLIAETCAFAVGTSEGNAADLIYNQKWSKDPFEFRRQWNKREIDRAFKSAALHVATPSRAVYNTRLWHSKTPEEKLAYTRAKRAKAIAAGKTWPNRTHKVSGSGLIAKRYRQRVRNLLGDNYWGDTKSEDLLGCSVSFFRKYIEVRFKHGMTWDNMQDWNLDHILPCATFDLTKKAEIKKCFHYTNYRPEWAFRNKSRGCKLDEQQLEMTA